MPRGTLRQSCYDDYDDGFDEDYESPYGSPDVGSPSLAQFMYRRATGNTPNDSTFFPDNSSQGSTPMSRELDNKGIAWGNPFAGAVQAMNTRPTASNSIDGMDCFVMDHDDTDMINSYSQSGSSALATAIGLSASSSSRANIGPPSGFESKNVTSSAFDFSTSSPDDIELESKKNRVFRSGGAPKLTVPVMSKANNRDNSTPVKSNQIIKEREGNTTGKQRHGITPVKRDNATPVRNANILMTGSASGSTPSKDFGPQRLPAKQHEIDEALSKMALSDDIKDHISLVVVGHVDAGKSTLMGHMLFKLGNVSQKTMHKYEKMAAQIGKSSFAFAWVLDDNDEERQRGVTIDVGVSRFDTSKKRVTLLDAPGHRDFVPNMISGASQADVAVLVVNALRGEFEAGFDDGGQTREHAVLLRSLGVQQVIVAVNKLDMEEWSQTRFNHIVERLSSFLKQVGYKYQIPFIPVSGLTGENLVSRSADVLSSWYDGPTLISAIDNISPATRNIEGPFRLCTTDVFKSQRIALAFCGKIESGVVAVGDRILMMPTREMCTVKSIDSNGESVAMATAGDNVDIGIIGADMTNMRSGLIACDPERPIPIVKKLEAQIITLEMSRPIVKGQSFVIHLLSISESCKVTKLKGLVNRATGEVDKKVIRCIPSNATASVEITITRPICMELFADFKQLGRFMLRESGKTVAAGIVTLILS